MIRAILFTITFLGFGLAYAQEEENNLVLAGIISVDDAPLFERPDSNAIILAHLKIKTTFLINDTEPIFVGRRVFYWYKVSLADNKTTGWLNSNDIEIGQTDSISFKTSEFQGLYCTTATNAWQANGNFDLAESIYLDVLAKYPDTKFRVYDEIIQVDNQIDTRLYVLNHLAGLYISKKEFKKSIEINNEIINLKESGIQDILKAEMQIIDIYHKELEDFEKTIELCHNVIIKYPNQEITGFECNYWVDIHCADILTDICRKSKNDHLLFSECNRMISETGSPAVSLIATSGLATYYIQHGLFDLLESTLVKTLNKYPAEERLYFKTLRNYSLLPVMHSIETIINENGDYEYAGSLLNKISIEISNGALLDYFNYKSAWLLDQGTGDIEAVLSAYNKVSTAFFTWDFINKTEISFYDVNKRIEQLKAFKGYKAVLNQDIELKDGLKSGLPQPEIVMKGTEIKVLYADNTFIKQDGRFGILTKIKLPDNRIGWIFDGYLDVITGKLIFDQTDESEHFWDMEGANPERTNAVDEEMILEPEIKIVIENVSGKEIVFSDANDDHIPDLFAYSTLGLTAIDGATQKILWAFSCNHGSIPLITKDLIYISAYTNGKEYFLALNKKDASIVWKDVIGDQEYGGTPSSPVIEKNTIFNGTRQSGIIAYNKDTGGRIWEYPLNYPVIGTITVADNLVYFSSRKNFDDNDFMFALDATTGKVRWNFDFLAKNSFYLNQGGVIYKKKLICNGGNGNLYALNTETGKLIWKTQLDEANYRSASYRPAISDGMVYFTVPDKGIWALNAENGMLSWKNEYPHSFSGVPVLANDALYIRSIDSYVHAISLKDGSTLWKLKTGSDAYGGDYSISLVQGKIFVGSTDNKIYVIGEK
jgi:outer membrane protein assembly factor BamB/tetratricopeptide (TPR) repeat protein